MDSEKEETFAKPVTMVHLGDSRLLFGDERDIRRE